MWKSRPWRELALTLSKITTHSLPLFPSSHTIAVSAVADPPTLTAPASVSAVEDIQFPIPGLSAALVDNVTANGGEILSVVITGVPENSIFNAGSNNGGGSWNIPVAKLATLELKLPEHYSGNITLLVTAITLESSNLDEANTTRSIDLSVTPVADTYLIVAKDIVLNSTGIGDLDLNIRLVDVRGSTTGETPPEIITLTFTAVPSTLLMFAREGGRVLNPAIGEFSFTGTPSQANALSLVQGPGTISNSSTTVSISGVTIDGNSILSPPVTDNFLLVVRAASNPGTSVTNLNTNASTLIGSPGNDIIVSSNGDDTIGAGAGSDQITGGKGSDTMTGGIGRDLFVWSPTDVNATASPDVITDFEVGLDQLNFASLTSSFNHQFDDPADFVQLTQNGANVLVEVKQGAGFVPVVVLQGLGSLTLSALVAAGGLQL